MMYEVDYHEEMNTARAMGLAEGRAIGDAEGNARGRAEVARNMKAINMAIADIATVTGLSLEEIVAL